MGRRSVEEKETNSKVETLTKSQTFLFIPLRREKHAQASSHSRATSHSAMLSSSFVGSTRLSSTAARAGGASLYGARVAVPAPVSSRIGLVVEAAHKKGSGHSKNGRDSVSKVCIFRRREKCRRASATREGEEGGKKARRRPRRRASEKAAAASRKTRLVQPSSHIFPLRFRPIQHHTAPRHQGLRR